MRRLLDTILVPLLTVLLFLSAVPATDAAEVRIFPATATANSGAVVSLSIQVDSATDLAGFQFDFSWLPASLEVKALAIAPTFENKVKNSFDTATGRGLVAAYSATPQSGANITLATIEFTVTGSGASVVTIANQILGTINGDEIVSTVSGSTITGVVPALNITFTPGSGGTLSGVLSQTVPYGSAATSVTANADPGFHFANWSGSNSFIITTVNPLIITGVTSGYDIVANFAPDPVSGVCGSSSGGTFASAPTVGLCSLGTPTPLTGAGPWSWSCSGANGGTTAACSAAIDITGPALTVSTLAAGTVTNNATLNVSGTATDSSGPVTVKINGVSVAAATTDGSFSHAVTLSDGANSITVVAADALGNSTSESRSVILDQAAPTLTISTPTDNSKTAQALSTISGTVSETSTVKIALNGGTPQIAAITGTTFSADVVLASGLNTIIVTATDLALNASSVVRTVTWDNSKPSLAVTTPAQDITTAQNSLTVSGTVSDTLTGATVMVSLNGQTYTPAVTAGAFSQLLTFPAEGTWPITVTATDEVGNSTSVIRTVIYAVPVTGVCGSSAGQELTVAPTTGLCNLGTPTPVTGSGPWNWVCSGSNGGTDAACSSDLQTYQLTFTPGSGGTLSGALSQTVPYGSAATSVTANADPGFHFVNWSGSNGFIITTVNPLIITGVTSGYDIVANFAPDPVSGVCGSSAGRTLTAAPTTGLCSLGAPTPISGSGPWNWSCSGSNGGTTAACSAAIDITGPALTVSTLADGTRTNNATLNVSGVVSDPSGPVTVKINGVTVAVSTADGSFSTAVTLQSGANAIAVITTDSLGNSTTDSRAITLDQAAPALTVSAPTDNSKTAQALSTISGTVSETSTVKIALNGGTPQSAAISGTTFSADVSLASGLNTITVTATDLALNASSVVRTVTWDNSKPSLAVTTPAQDITTAQNSLTVSGTVSDTLTGATVMVSLNGQTYTPAVTAGDFSQLLTFPAEGIWPITVTATDEVGNSTSVIRTVIYAVPVTGICGSSAGQALTTAPTTGLCSLGTPTPVTGSGPWSWSCSGIKGGTDAACSSDLQTYQLTFTPGSGGALSGVLSQTVPYGSAATSVTANADPGFHFVNWSGSNGFIITTVNPLIITGVTSGYDIVANFAPDPVSGVCGSSAGRTLTTAPSTGLCSLGAPTPISGSGPWNWSCSGSNGGTAAACTAAIDITGPALAVSTLADGETTNNATLNVSGTVSDPSGLAGLKLNGIDVLVTGGSFSSAITLTPGVNTVAVVAVDTLGNRTSDSRNITLDQTAPTLTVTGPADNSKTALAQITVNGTISETSTVAVSVNSGTPHTMNGSSFSVDVALVPGLNSIAVTATDHAGNKTGIVRSITCDNNKPSLAVTVPNQDITTNLTSLTLSGTVSDALSTPTVTVGLNGQTFNPAVTNDLFSQLVTFPAEGTWPITVTATDEVGNSSSVTRTVIYAAPVNGLCGASAGQTLSAAPTVDLCTVGSASIVTGSGPWSWSCSGSNGGMPSSCSAVIHTPDDTTVPVVTDFTLQELSTTLTVPVTACAATDASGVTGYLLSESAVKPPASDASWGSAVPKEYTFKTWGHHILYAYAKDSAGNVANGKPATVFISIERVVDGIIIPGPTEEPPKVKPELVDALKSLKYAMGIEEPPKPDNPLFRHCDVAPLKNGVPDPDGLINLGDTIVILRRVLGM
jgi:hypothetical protein